MLGDSTIETNIDYYLTIWRYQIIIIDMSKTTVVLLALVALLILGGGGFYLYSNQLQKSKEEGKNILSRAIPDDAWANKGNGTLVSQISANSKIDTSKIPCYIKTEEGNRNIYPENYTNPIDEKGKPINILPVIECGQEYVPISKLDQKLLKTGQFVSLDPAHYAKGSVNLIENGDSVKVTFSDDFETNPDGPDLYVWLVKKQEIKNIAIGGVSSQVGDYLDLGPIQSKAGSQAYQISKSELAGKDYALVIWCRAFGIQFSNALLK
jgi:hypothetical protein